MSTLSRSDLIRELKECGKDPIYFLKTYAKIQHPIRGLIPFSLYPYQEDVVRAFINHRLNVILKARQLGFTTLAAGFIAWFVLFHRDKNVLIVSTKAEVATNTIRMVRVILNFLPKQMMLTRITVNNRRSIELNNGSRVKAVTTTGDAGRSEAVSLLFVDEVAHIEKMDELWTGIFPTISTGGRALLSSTPNGTANFFYRIYKQAQNHENNFNCRYGMYKHPQRSDVQYSDRFPWWVHPEHDEQWFANETAGKSARDISQEYECNFNTSGDTFLPADELQRLESKVSDPIDRLAEDRNLWIWQFPEPGAIYLLVCDVSSGFAKDYSAFHVIRIDNKLEQVAEYKGKIPPDLLGELCMKVSQQYNNATIAPENNSGWAGQMIQRITDCNYPHLYWQNNRNMYVENNYGGYRNAIPGYSVTNANRMSMLAKMEQYVRRDDIKVNSPRLLDEFREFIWVNNKPQAARSANDDLIMAFAGGIWVREESFMASYRGIDYAQAMLAATSATNVSVAQCKSFNQSQTDTRAVDRQKQMRMDLGNGEIVDLSRWLLSG